VLGRRITDPSTVLLGEPRGQFVVHARGQVPVADMPGIVDVVKV